jgi:hypothetical protein
MAGEGALEALTIMQNVQAPDCTFKTGRAGDNTAWNAMLVSLEPQGLATSQANSDANNLAFKRKPRQGTCTEIAALLFQVTLPALQVYRFRTCYYYNNITL